jgi:long-chain acyl-CoA synthetase
VNAIGLWTIAPKLPDKTAVVEPDGTVVTYADLASGADRYGREDPYWAGHDRQI